MARVLIAGREEATRNGIRAALEAAGHRVCAECRDAGATVESAHRTRPAVCLIELDLPGGGISAVRAIAARRRPPRLLVLAPRFRDEDLFAALRAGACGLVLTTPSAARVAADVDAALAEGVAMPARLTARLIDELRASGTVASAPRREAR